MRHRKRTAKLGRQFEHRNAMLANLVCSLIKHRRITTTLAKAKAARSVAEKMVTLGKSGTIHHRRLAVARLHQEDAAKILFKDIAPGFKDRNGGYTRIIRLNQRQGDSAQRAIIEWVDFEFQPEPEPKKEEPKAKKEGDKKADKKGEKKAKEAEAKAAEPANA